MSATPSVEALEKMIGTAYETLPHADPKRLRALQARLMLPTRTSPPRFVWILGAFFTAGAAAWWAGDLFFPDPPPAQKQSVGAGQNVVNEKQHVPEAASPDTTGQDKKEPKEDETRNDSQPKIIYRLEP